MFIFLIFQVTGEECRCIRSRRSDRERVLRARDNARDATIKQAYFDKFFK